MPTPTFRLRFPESAIKKWSLQYDYPGEQQVIAGPVAKAKKNGYLDMETFLAIGEWKSKRPRARQKSNPAEFVEEVTRVALAPSTSPRLAIEALTLLAGVSWPTASVILHFCHARPYPILDFRALWSVSCPVPARYTFTFWEDYTDYVCALAHRNAISMRDLDRALWTYSRLHQRRGLKRRARARQR